VATHKKRWITPHIRVLQLMDQMHDLFAERGIGPTDAVARAPTELFGEHASGTRRVA